MKKLFVFALVLLGLSCQKEKVSDFTLTGSVKNLKKGTVYLQKFEDSVYVTVDSVVLNGTSDFVLQSELSEPEVLFVRLDKNAKEEDIIPFFADKGTMTLRTTLKNFSFDAVVEGSQQQKVLDEYIKMMDKFNDKNLELIEDSFNTKDNTDSTLFGQKYQKESMNLLRRKYLYTINFAVMNSDSEVSPYLALNEISNANPKYLDTIYKALTDRVKTSKYGLELEDYLSKIKDTLK